MARPENGAIIVIEEIEEVKSYIVAGHHEGKRFALVLLLLWADKSSSTRGIAAVRTAVIKRRATPLNNKSDAFCAVLHNDDNRPLRKIGRR